MIFTRKLRENNQITVPPEVIEAYGMKIGDKVTFEVQRVIKDKIR